MEQQTGNVTNTDNFTVFQALKKWQFLHEMKWKLCELLTCYKDFFNEMERWENFQIPVTDPSKRYRRIHCRRKSFSKYRPIFSLYDESRQNWIWDTEIITFFWIAFDDLEKEMAEF
jgi:hypothetical protein